MSNWILEKVREEVKVVLDCQVLNCFPIFRLRCYLCICSLLLKKKTLFGDNGGFAKRQFKH